MDTPIKTLILEDELVFYDQIRLSLSEEDYVLTLVKSLSDARQAIQCDIYDLFLVDRYLENKEDTFEFIPELRKNSVSAPIIVFTHSSSTDSIQKALDFGATDYVVKTDSSYEELPGRIRVAKQRMKLEQNYLVDRVKTEKAIESSLVGTSPGMNELRKQISELASTSLNIVIEGESGTGKELVARALYQNAKNKTGPFITLNCSSFTKELIESELFGHVKGAFTGAAADKPGKIELAKNGDLFLDEIGELSLDIQPKLLRVLETGEFYRVGSNYLLNSKPRIISATHRSLEEMVKNGTFREDLYYRIKGEMIETLPLRNRLEDIPLIVRHFVNFLVGETFGISSECIKILQAHPWPGNIRELRNAIESAVAFAKGRDSKMITAQDLAKTTQFRKKTGLSKPAATPQSSEKPEDVTKVDYVEYMRQAQYRYLLETLKIYDFNADEAAEKLGISVPSVYRRCRDVGLTFKQIKREQKLWKLRR